MYINAYPFHIKVRQLFLTLLMGGYLWAMSVVIVQVPVQGAILNQSALFDCTTVTEIPHSECEVLIELYNSMGGPAWADNSNWLQTSTPCHHDAGVINPKGWVGVRCLFGNIVWLQLDNNRLNGTIPSALGRLTQLYYVDLQSNQLGGTLPQELGDLPKLIALWLNDNRLSGQIPAELGNLLNLQALSLATNYLTDSIPPELGNLTNLLQFYLHENRLDGSIPPELGNLTSLTNLRLDKNQLSGSIPSDLTNLAALQIFFLDENQLQGLIPSGLDRLINLRHLTLDDNQLSGPIPPELGNLPYLERLWLDNNRLSGTIPPELGNLRNLIDLYLHNNQLDGAIPPELGNLPHLSTLYLHTNGLRGSLPSELADLGNLTYLALGNNQLSGSIPPEFGGLSNLIQFSIQNNQLDGPIPPELGGLTNLTWLNLQNNQFRGDIPVQLGSLALLTELNLSQNKFSGTIPVTLGDLGELRVLELHSNQLSGTLPAEIGNLTQLLTLYLQDNRLRGALPVSMINLQELAELNLDHNGFTAPLPTLQAFLDTKAPDWAATQTVAPNKLTTHIQSESAIALTWTPISYTLDSGFYEINYATTAEGPFTVHGQTAHKRTNAYTVDQLEPATTYYFRVRTHTPSHHNQQNELWSQESITVSAATPNLGEGDIYEPNNACVDARTLVADGRLMDHSFHQSGDADWMQFQAQAGITYRIDVQIPSESTADVALTLFEECGGNPAEEQNTHFSAGVRLDFQPERDSPIYLRLVNGDETIGTAQHTYRLAVRTLSEEARGGAMILVAGRLQENNPLQANVDHVANSIYHFFRSQGYSDEAIQYLASDPTLPGVDGKASVAQLRDAIVSWALNQVGSQQTLTLYLIGHGEPGRLIIDLPSGESITPADLNIWLTQLEESVPNILINVIIEAAYGGSFITDSESLSKPGRVIMTSTSNDLGAIASQEGLHFSDHLLTGLKSGHHLFGAYWEARVALLASHAPMQQSWQEPWLDADGNGIANELEDAHHASLRGFAPAATSGHDTLWSPDIIDVRVIDHVLQAHVRDDASQPQVWAQIYAPSYTIPQAGLGFIAEDPATNPDIHVVSLTTQAEDRYTATLDNLCQGDGRRFVLYAQDDDGLLARPLEVNNFMCSLPADIYQIHLPFIRD